MIIKRTLVFDRDLPISARSRDGSAFRVDLSKSHNFISGKWRCQYKAEPIEIKRLKLKQNISSLHEFGLAQLFGPIGISQLSKTDYCI